MKKYPVNSRTALALSLLLLVSLPIRSSRAQSTHPPDDPDEPRERTSIFGTGSTQALRHARRLTRRYLGEHSQVFGLDRRNQLKVLRSWVDELAMAHVRVQQTFDDVPVFGGQAIVHLKTDGTVSQVTNSWVNELNVDTTPSLTAAAAVDFATATFGCLDCQPSQPKVQLWVLRRDGVDRLVYEVRLQQLDQPRGPSMPVCFVDAHTGEIVWSYDNLQTATGASLYSDNVSFNTFFKANNYYLEDITRKVGTYSYHNGTTTPFSITDTDDIWTNATAADAHYGMSTVIDYFKNVHGRDGLSGDAGPSFTISQDGVTPLFAGNINYGVHYVNAFWNGQTVFFGDGDGVIASPLVTVDIIGHEMTHALTEDTAGLIYSGESGALNESISDVFGAMIERYAKGESDSTWSVAEECFTPGTAGDALRYLDDPHKASSIGVSAGDPDHYTERYIGQGDNHGVHVNAGIPNKAFYLLAHGGQHHLGGSMTGIGADEAAKIWYKALITYMTPLTDFAGAREATESAATDLFGAGSPQLSAVSSAWCLVGVGSGNCQATEPTPPTQLQNGVPVPSLSGAANSQTHFYMSVPTGATNLSFKTAGGSGDVDLYVKFGAPPTLTNYDCRPYTNGNNEVCTRSTPAAGNWYVMLRGYAPYSGVTLTGSYLVSSPPTPPTQLQNGVPVSNLSDSTGAQKLFYMTVPAGATNLSFKTAGGSGDADLYVKFGSPPTLTSYDCRPYTNGNNEVCTRPTPAAGDWYVMLRAYASYSGVTLTGSYLASSSGGEMIVNGGFEGGAAPWVLSGAAHYANGRLAHNGLGFISLGQTNNATGTVYQEITIPSTATSADLRFYLALISNETTRTVAHDQLFVEVLSSSGRSVETLATYSNLNEGAAGVYSLKGSFNLLSYRGQTVRLQFRAATNDSLTTTFRIDDVSVR